MNDKDTTIEELKQLFAQFVKEQGWENLTDPKDLSMNIVSEATELMDLFLFKDQKEIQKLLQKPEPIENEVADIAFALFNFCTTFNIDLSKAIEHKLKILKKKY